MSYIICDFCGQYSNGREVLPNVLKGYWFLEGYNSLDYKKGSLQIYQ